MSINQLILATLAYHDIFDYPLSEDEVHRFLIEKKVGIASIKDGLNNLRAKSIIGNRYGFYYLKNRAQIARTRLTRENYSRRKFKRALFYGALLKAIPTVKLVAISGALAMNNSRKNDDIDLLIITSRGRLWTTRFLANLILFPYKRHPQGKKTKDKACLNLFLEESSLKIKNQNLYIAHEICQTKPLWDRSNAYQKLILANIWVKKYLPNWQPSVERLTTNVKRQSKSSALTLKNFLSLEAFQTLITLVERVAKWGQINYMKSKITTEKIGKGQLFFHPKDTQNLILKKFHDKLSKLKIN